MLLENKNAVVYGGGGVIGGAVARAFAREGATVHLAGRTRSSLQAVADDIAAAGGKAEAAQVDAFDPDQVDAHADAVAAAHGSLDVSFNIISHPDHIGTPALQMAYEDFEEPVSRRLRTMWITSRAAARHMVESIARNTMLGRPATLADVGNAAVFAASDWSRALTGTKLNITCGGVAD